MNNVLVTVKDYNKNIGGIANYYKILSVEIECLEFFFIGFGNNKNPFTKIIRIITLYADFYKKISNPDVKKIIVNPSLEFSCIVRDSIFVILSKIRKKSTIVFFRGWNPYVEKFFNRKLFKPFLYFFINSDLILVLSEKFKRKLLAWGCKKEIIVETTIVDKYIFNDNINLLNTRLSDFDIFNAKILFLSRIIKEKGIYIAVDAYKRIKEKYKGLSLCIAGDGDELQSLKNYVQLHKISDIEFAGALQGEKKREIYTTSHIFLFPSFHEGMPNAVLEAMSYGLAVISNNVGGLSDFFEDYKMGFLCNSLNPTDYAHKIEFIINNPTDFQKISEYNINFAKKTFSSDVVSKRISNIVNSVK